MDTDKRTDAVLDAYDEAFRTLPVYGNGNVMDRKMNDVDRLARDVAFEIVLGGDRFDPADVAAQLDGISPREMQVFRGRIAYHAEDFAPPEYRTEDFMNRMTEAWTAGVRLDGRSDSLRRAFSETELHSDRGRWFRFRDGSFRKCTKAAVDAMWRGRDLEGLEAGPVTPLDVLRAKADALIAKYGKEVRLDGPWDSVDVDTYGLSEAGHVMSLRRNVDILARKPEDHVYYVTYRTPSGSSSTLLSHLEPEEMERMIGVVDGETAFRGGLSVMNGVPGLSGGSLVALPQDTVVYAPEYGPTQTKSFVAASVFVGPGEGVMVSGRFTGQDKGTPDFNYPLADFSDRSVAVIKEATDRSMKAVLSKMAALETGRRAAPADRKVKELGPSI